MGEYIDQVKTITTSAYKKLRIVFKDIKLRVAFIGYRDYDKKGKRLGNQIIKLPFTSKDSEFEEYVKNVKPEGGKLKGILIDSSLLKFY